MTTGHWDPGYGDTVTRLRRARSAVAAGSRTGARRLQQANLDSGTLDDIKQRAKDQWLMPDRAQTSYNDHFKERVLDVSDITTARPTSAQRKHKPHPKEVFLTTHLHNVPGYGRINDIPGYHNPDTTIGKDAYKMDRSLPTFEQEYRRSLRDKFIGRPSTAAVNQYRRIEGLDVIEDPIERQGLEAYLKLASKQDQTKILGELRKKRSGQNYDYEDYERSGHAKLVPSVNRYMKFAGAEEAHKLTNRAWGSTAYPDYDLVTRRMADIHQMRNSKYTHKSKRGDFLMHPEWPPQFSHHRLNGLSSVDVPYYPGRR